MRKEDNITYPRQVAAPETPLNSIGTRIRNARKTLGLNQEALANRLGVTQPTVANWEADVHNPRQLMLAKLAEALSVSLGWLASGDEADRTPLPVARSGYVSRALYHVPVIPAHLLVGDVSLKADDLHAVAVDYIPISARSGRHYAVFLDSAPYETTFPGDELFVFDATRQDPITGCYSLIGQPTAPPRLHLWGISINQPPLRPEERILGTLAITVRFF